MVPLATQLIVQIAILSTAGVPARTYRDAYHQAAARQQPLLVLVGDATDADYQKLRAEYLPVVARDGLLNEVAFAIVDRDKHPEIAKRLLQDAPSTQLVLYIRTGEQWQRSHLSPPDSPEEIRTFLKQNIEAAKTMQTNYTVPIQWGSS